MKKKTIIILGIFIIAVCNNMNAQDIEVRKFELLEKDQTAVMSPRKDINGNACGLVRVALKEPGAEFEGSVMGDVQFTGKEYLVYLPNGTKRLGIKHPDYLPTTIVFADYGTKKIASSTTYELKVKTNKKKAKIDDSKKGIAVFNIKPSNAMLLIDGQAVDGAGGAYTLSLPYGTHYYTVKLQDFAITNQTIKIDKEAKNINVDLTEYYAKVDISCPTEDAEILINNEQKGVDRWVGMMIPGKYTIVAQKDGCHPQSRQVVLKDNDAIKVDFTALKTITGNLRVNFEPAGADVLLNGKKVGVTPLVLKELPVGDYQLEIWKEWYVKKFITVKIREDQEWKEKGKLEMTEFREFFMDAEFDINSDGKISTAPCAQDLGSYYRRGAAFDVDADPWFCEKDTFHIPINPVLGVRWWKKLFREGKDYTVDEERFCFGECYGLNDEELSFCLALKEYEEEKDWLSWSYRASSAYLCLAWHYFYGRGCKKNIDKAKKLVRDGCPKGEYKYPAFTELIKEMGLDKELKYNPKLKLETPHEYY